ncbi:hypothetical protein NE237_007761 [Protea cynaroides]|uniref:Uncharacterized protein n=1 Tax=Protea cynaroides TaxID=273540 RepID=A0A9Q0KPS9_9MAGN|nr:hypothetical protein NE237_007761 [Protea cynaroides]
MRVKGSLQNKLVTILIDSESTYNFVSQTLANKLGLQPLSKGRLEVMVASASGCSGWVSLQTDTTFHSEALTIRTALEDAIQQGYRLIRHRFQRNKVHPVVCSNMSFIAFISLHTCPSL